MSLAPREEHRLKVYGNRVLRGIFGEEDCMMRSFVTYTLHQVLLESENPGR
jgi:hypothetical protein